MVSYWKCFQAILNTEEHIQKEKDDLMSVLLIIYHLLLQVLWLIRKRKWRGKGGVISRYADGF